MRKTDQEVVKLMKEYEKHGEMGRAARAAGMDRKTARKYLKEGKLPSELREARTWRTREDPFKDAWGLIQGILEDYPEAEAKSLLDYLISLAPQKYQESHLRTLQRRIKVCVQRKVLRKKSFSPRPMFQGKGCRRTSPTGRNSRSPLQGNSSLT